MHTKVQNYVNKYRGIKVNSNLIYYVQKEIKRHTYSRPGLKDDDMFFFNVKSKDKKPVVGTGSDGRNMSKNNF